MGDGYIEVQGVDQLNRTLRHAADKGLVKAVGRANKKVGRKFIDQWLHPKPQPASVGEGAGAAVRPSAAKRELKLRVGGKHRAGNTPRMQWGKRLGRKPYEAAPKRPYIRESAERHRDDIYLAWLDEIDKELAAGGLGVD